MNDTNPHLEKIYSDMMRSKSGAEKLKMGCSMFSTSKALIAAGIRHRQPGISDIDLKVAVFLKLYGDDFDEEQKQKIIAHLRKNATNRSGFLQNY
ncbi:hypothetical protein FJZ31_03240 [Candidatus Poribacteria bacterium]|nr:hypothetical protein [Candidatus Poribacteria bacterium]